MELEPRRERSITAAITATMTIPANARCFKSPMISSIANTMAASGVLKAAAIPPAQTSGMRDITCRGANPNNLPTDDAKAAESYTVGPSLPRLAPDPMEIVPSMNLITAALNLIRPNFR